MALRFNISFIGDSHVGKTTLANMLLNQSFSTQYEPTIGASMLKIPYTEEDQTIWFHVFDTAGMEKYKSLAPVYYRDSNLGVIVFDLGVEETFDHIDSWLSLYRSYTETGNPILLIGNKIDTVNQDQTSLLDKAKLWAANNKVTFLSTSAKDNINIDMILPTIYNLVKESLNTQKRKDPKVHSQKEKKGGCC